MPRPRAVIIGAGIGGLTTALALHRRGWHTTVLERAATLNPVGAALILSPNAQRALAALGLGDEVAALAAWQGDGLMCDPLGRPLHRSNGSAIAARFGAPLVALRRSDLVDLIVERLPDGILHTGEAAFLTDAGTAGRQAHVSTSQAMYKADLVIAADGVDSATRATLFPDSPGPVYGGWTIWCILVPRPGPDFVPHASWGAGLVWVSLVRDPDNVFVYACAATEEGGRSPGGERAELVRRFGRWHEPVPTLVEAVGEDEILRHDVYHMAEPLASFHRGRTALLGDAAHAMVPTLGQGVGMAIEDGVVLAHHATPATDPLSALAAYDRDRRPRTTAMARRAERVLKLTSLRSAAAVALRDAVFKAASQSFPSLLLRGFDHMADWHPPTTKSAVALPPPQDPDGPRAAR